MTARATETSATPVHEIAIVGSDLLLQALPARPVQLSHALLAAGFELVVPASWGDELLAEHAVYALSAETSPRIYCCCPRVRGRLMATGDELVPHLVALVAPPAAAARYIRQVWPDANVRITYIGSCEGADDPAIDERLTPQELLTRLEARGIDPLRLPATFRDVIPPDRRRYWSLPGGCPAAEVLTRQEIPRELRIVGQDAYAQEIVEGLLGKTSLLLDVAEALGCACAGAVPLHGVVASRSAVVALEPPRAPRPVLDTDVRVALEYRPRLAIARVSAPSVPSRVTPSHSVAPRRPVALEEPPVAVPPAAGTILNFPAGEGSRRRLAVTPPGVGAMAAREGRQPPHQPLLPHREAPPADPPIDPVRRHRPPRLRMAPSTRVTRTDGQVVPRAFAAVHRTPRGTDVVLPSDPQQAPPSELSALPEPVVFDASSPDLPPAPLVEAETGDVSSDIGFAKAPRTEPIAETNDSVQEATPTDHTPSVAAVDTPPPSRRDPLRSGIQVPRAPLRPVPSPPPPQPRRLRGLLATVAMIIALTLLMIAVFGM